MDLATLDTAAGGAQGSRLHLRHPVTNEPLFDDRNGPVTLVLAGSDSQTYRKAQRDLVRAAQRARKVTLTLEDQEENATELLARSTIGWENIEVDGAVVPFSLAAARDLYARFRWIREQVDAFIHDRQNFLPPASPD